MERTEVLDMMGELKLYHDHVRANPADGIYRDATPEFTGPERLERLTRNLVRALKDEAILLVLDNFETNLKPQVEPATVIGQPIHAFAQDPGRKLIDDDGNDDRPALILDRRRTRLACSRGGLFSTLHRFDPGTHDQEPDYNSEWVFHAFYSPRED